MANSLLLEEQIGYSGARVLFTFILSFVGKWGLGLIRPDSGEIIGTHL